MEKVTINQISSIHRNLSSDAVSNSSQEGFIQEKSRKRFSIHEEDSSDMTEIENILMPRQPHNSNTRPSESTSNVDKEITELSLKGNFSSNLFSFCFFFNRKLII